HPEQRRLALAVRPYDTYDPATGELERDVVDEHAVTVGLGHVVGLDDDVAEAGPRRDSDLERRHALLGGLREERFIVAEARLALGLAGARRHPDPLELALERAPPRHIGLLLLLESPVLLLEPGRVVALPRDAVASVELEDPACDVVEEIQVVGDRDDRPGVLLQKA